MREHFFPNKWEHLIWGFVHVYCRQKCLQSILIILVTSSCDTMNTRSKKHNLMYQDLRLVRSSILLCICLCVKFGILVNVSDFVDYGKSFPRSSIYMNKSFCFVLYHFVLVKVRARLENSVIKGRHLVLAKWFTLFFSQTIVTN